MPWRDYSPPSDNTLQITHGEDRLQTSRRGEQLGLGKKLRKASFKGNIEGKQKAKSGGGNVEISRTKQGRREVVQQNTGKRTDVYR